MTIFIHLGVFALEGTLSTSPTEINADATLTVLVNC